MKKKVFLIGAVAILIIFAASSAVKTYIANQVTATPNLGSTSTQTTPTVTAPSIISQIQTINEAIAQLQDKIDQLQFTENQILAGMQK
jgi:TolA-binding protein